MKKKILGFVLAICLVLPCTFMMSACDDGKLDIAYVQYQTEDTDKKVLYYSGQAEQIFLVPSDSTASADYLLKIYFAKDIGVANINEQQTMAVNIEKWSEMTIYVKKAYYDASKKVYLNGVDITATANSTFTKPPIQDTNNFGTFWQDAVYNFNDFGLVKGNTSDYINIIEYK